MATEPRIFQPGACVVCGAAYAFGLRRLCPDCVAESQRLSKLFRARREQESKEK